MYLKKQWLYVLVSLVAVAALSGCHTVVKDAVEVDRTIYQEAPSWM